MSDNRIPLNIWIERFKNAKFDNDNWVVIRDNQTIEFKKLQQALNFLSTGGD